MTITLAMASQGMSNMARVGKKALCPATPIFPAASPARQGPPQVIPPRSCKTVPTMLKSTEVQNADADPAARLTIQHAGGTATKTINFTTGSAGWVDLGSYPFTVGAGGTFTNTNSGAGCTRTSMVKFVRYSFRRQHFMTSIRDFAPFRARSVRHDGRLRRRRPCFVPVLSR